MEVLPKKYPNKHYILSPGDDITALSESIKGSDGAFFHSKRFSFDGDSLIGNLFFINGSYIISPRLYDVIIGHQIQQLKLVPACIENRKGDEVSGYYLLENSNYEADIFIEKSTNTLIIKEPLLEVIKQFSTEPWGFFVQEDSYFNWFRREHYPKFFQVYTNLESLYQQLKVKYFNKEDISSHEYSSFLEVALGIVSLEDYMIDYGGMLPNMRKFKTRLEEYQRLLLRYPQEIGIGAQIFANKQDLMSHAVAMNFYIEAVTQQ